MNETTIPVWLPQTLEELFAKADKADAAVTAAFRNGGNITAAKNEMEYHESRLVAEIKHQRRHILAALRAALPPESTP